MALIGTAWSCAAGPGRAAEPTEPSVRTAGFLLVEGVYTSELVAPFDVLQHTGSHAEPGLSVFTVGRTRDPVRTFEGLVITPDHDFDSAPAIDVLVIPSAEHSMDLDLRDERLIAWVRERGRAARYVLSVCDGAFLLAAAGLLDGHCCTTYPADIAALRERYPELEVLEGVSFVVDGNRITGVGGAASYQPALYLVERLFGQAVAEGIGRGLVIDWQLEQVEHVIVR